MKKDHPRKLKAERVQLLLYPPLSEKLARLAEREHRSLQAQITVFVERGLKEVERSHESAT